MDVEKNMKNPNYDNTYLRVNNYQCIREKLY